MNPVTSKDGTSIAFDRIGSGPAVILVGGGLVDPVTGRAGRWENAPLATALAESFTVLNYDRRGRADSGDTLPYAVGREIEDIDALIAEAGGSAHLFGVSSGGALAMEAAAAGLAVDKLAVFDVPYLPEEMLPYWREYREQLGAALAGERRSDAVELFMRLAGSSDDDVAGAKSSPFWESLETIAHTLAYDAECLGDGRTPTARLAKITQPTLVATAGPSPEEDHTPGLPTDFYDHAANAIVEAIPKAERLVIQGTGHVADPKTVGPALERFFKG